MTTARRQLFLTLAAAGAGAAVMLAAADTFNPAFCCVASEAYGWPFPWQTIDSHHSGPGLRHPADYWVYNFTILLGASFFIGRCVHGRSVVRPTLTVIAMLTIAPLITVALVVCCTPDRDELLYPVAVATYVFYGFRGLWLTYIPALIIVPFLMKRIASRHDFSHGSLMRLLRQAALVGGIGGGCVMVPRAVWALFDGGPHFLFVVGLGACAVAGAITLGLICLLYRYGGSPAEPDPSQNRGPAVPSANSSCRGAPSVIVGQIKTDSVSRPPSPCKTFNKKRAITCYKLLFNPDGPSFDHFEYLRVSNETPGEYYVLPIETLQKQARRHISYHKSGAFHWREDDGSKVVPRDGESDERRAVLMVQAMAHVSGHLDGYCISKGRDVSDESLAIMVDIMDGYIIPPLRLLGVAAILRANKSQTIPMIMSPYQAEAQRLFAVDAKNGEQTVFGADELEALLRQSIGMHAKVVQLNPKPERYVAYSKKTMIKVSAIARRMVAEKMDNKPKGFWTTPPSLNLPE